MYEIMNIKEIEKDLSIKIKKRRVSLGFTQREFALKAHISISTYRIFEQSGKGSFENFIKIIKMLGLINQLDNMIKPIELSVVDIVKNKKTKEKQRVKKVKSNNTVISTIQSNIEVNYIDMIKRKKDAK
jgi:transcriptional regulator with XRE-family HTH domain